MNISELPQGEAPEALRFEHFPTRQQAFVWRNWGLVDVDRLAKIFGTTVENVRGLAAGMGLNPGQELTADWLAKGYVTLIRNNWHLLPYEQLLMLLDWFAEKLEYTLREEDFLYYKLGDLKPNCRPLEYRPLTDKEKEQTVILRQCVEKHFPEAGIKYSQKPFDFYSCLSKPSIVASDSCGKKFSDTIVYAYAAPYGDSLMMVSEELYPEILLERLAVSGVNGIWLQAVLYTLMSWKFFPELSVGYETRLKNLNALVQRAAKYGIGVYLYLNEPRAMSESFFIKNPEWLRGVKSENGELTSLCTSNPETLQFVYDATKFVFAKNPQLAGVFTISMSENLTHCHSRWRGYECPRCSKRRPEDVVVELNSTIARGVHDAVPSARVIVWTWAWADEWAQRAIDKLPDDVELMCVSEWGLPTNVGGVTGSVKDYSISQVGPSGMSKKLWQTAKARGLKINAKVQINTSWECSAVPYIPVVPLVEEHLNNLKGEGIDGTLASWTLGGYPGGNFPLLNSSAESIAEQYGDSAGKKVMLVWEIFSDAFSEFPFDVNVLYYALHNIGPANLLFAEPTGYKATMVGFPYDDIEMWRAIYPKKIFEQQWLKLSEKWKDGLDLLADTKKEIPQRKMVEFEDMCRISQACYCHFRSAYLQVAFILLRGFKENAARLIGILDEEIELAKTLERLAREDCRIGFEATNHYIYTPNDLREKVLNCEYLKEKINNEN